MLWAINTAKHEVTKYTSYFLLFCSAHVNSGLQYGPIQSQVVPVTRTEVEEIIRERNRVSNKVRENLSKAYLRNKKQYDKNRRPDGFEIHDKVLRRN